jgi:hypothetical protein
MVRDPLYRAIEEGLGRQLDPDLFEQCASELLRAAYPGLSPVRGGGDAGMDGSIPSTEAPPLPLVCTTAENVIGNLTRSLNSYKGEGGESRFAVLVTSQALTPRRRRNLEDRARALGFTLRNVHAQDDLVGRLYQDPKWRRELLGLTGEPPALSALPRTRRPFEAQPLIGREEELAWLRSQTGDCLVTGQPGSGKTAMLASLARADEGAFLISDVRAEIADSVRAQSPRRIFIDDAHRRHDLLIELFALRNELGADFSIVATCWPAESEAVQRSLDIPDDAVRHLPLLPRTQLAEIVKAVGIGGPDILIAEILNQSAGLPGLAVTLAHLSILRGTVDLARGDFLLRDVNATLGELVQDRAMPILAAFSLGGRSGFPLEVVAEALHLADVDVWDVVTRIESGGVVKEIGRGALAVEPAALREALVREVFFGGAKGLNARGLLKQTPRPAHTAETVIRSRGRGAAVPDELIHDLLGRCVPDTRWVGADEKKAWQLYAYSGPEAVDWILDRYPNLLHLVARPALYHRSSRVIPILLAEAVEDERELHTHPDHPLRLIQDWIKAGQPGTRDALRRRRRLLEAVRAWPALPGAARVVRRALAIAFSPEYEVSPADPVDPRQIRISMGHLTLEELGILRDWWPEAVHLLESVGLEDVRDFEPTVRQWAFPGMLHGAVTNDFAAAATAGAVQMLEDLARLGERFPGVVGWATRLAERAGLELRLAAPADRVYDVLFPLAEYAGDWKARHERQYADARALGQSWSDQAPEEIAALLVRYDCEGARAERSWPRFTDVAAAAIAERVEEPLRWINALVRQEAAADLVAPFLWRALQERHEGSEAVWHQLFDAGYRYLCLNVALRSAAASDEMLQRTFGNLEGAEQLVQTCCVRGEVTAERLIRLLEHSTAAVSAAAAEGVWYAGEKGKNVADELRPAWRTAIVRHGRSEHILREVFATDPEMAKEWLLARCGADVHSRFREDEAFAHAVAVLDNPTRRELLYTLDIDFGPPGFFGTLVGNDEVLFRALLARAELRRVHLEPLEGHPSAEWSRLASMALDAGYTPEDVVEATQGLGWSWTGNLSMMWDGWAESFRHLEEHEDERIRELGQIGGERAEAAAAAARQRERHEDVYGFD